MTYHKRLARDQRDHFEETAGDPCRALLIAIIRHARRDALGGHPAHSVDALRYFFSDNFAADCAALDIDPGRIRSLLAQELATREDGCFSEEAIRRIHTQYVTEPISLDALGRRYATTGPTLSALFHLHNLPVRPPGKPRRAYQSVQHQHENRP